MIQWLFATGAGLPGRDRSREGQCNDGIWWLGNRLSAGHVHHLGHYRAVLSQPARTPVVGLAAWSVDPEHDFRVDADCRHTARLDLGGSILGVVAEVQIACAHPSTAAHRRIHRLDPQP